MTQTFLDRADDFIGWGIDIFGEYLSPSSKGAKILDFSSAPTKEAIVGNKKVTYPDIPNYFYHSTFNDIRHKLRSGESLYYYGESLEKSISAEGEYKNFSASVSAIFGQESEKWTLTKFASNDFTYLKGMFHLNMTSVDDWVNDPEINQYFAGDFLKHLQGPDQLDAVEFLERYGTHWVSRVILGGICFIDYSSYSEGSITTETLSKQAQIAYNTLNSSISTGNSTEWERIQNEELEHMDLHLKVSGGDPVLIYAEPDKWADSIKDEPALIAFGNFTEAPDPSAFDAIVPMWAFLEKDSPRQVELMEAYEVIVEKHKTLMVELFAYPNWSDKQLNLGIGEYSYLGDIPGGWNDEVDSFRVPEGLVFTGWYDAHYKNFKYGPYRGPLNVPHIYESNKMSSAKIEKSRDVERLVTIFSWVDFNYRENHAVVFEGDYPKLSNLNVKDWNDEIDAIIVEEGLKVTGWQHVNYEGDLYGPYIGPCEVSEVEGINKWSSMKVERTE